MIYQFKTKQLLKSDLETVWDFVSSPRNLKKITPPYMGFDITSKDLPLKMYPGMIISYKVSPLLSIPTTWVTEITQVEKHKFFIDEQRVGPYTMWHHQHFLEETKDGILMTDIVTYKPPFGILGSIANSLFIKKKLKSIFDYRFVALEKIFNL
ncbi:MAG: SRPBCC family protein [Bacteroidota bacterium]|nr:SRPBCC family protein [Bacteroidota bacterium]|tara:strand:+ start:465 stop:923 length:459 start_codon:yes stop_codon:yes gene_type:complete